MSSYLPTFGQGDTLIYIGDPMCSWCYGFSPELDKIKAAFPKTPMHMVMGGLRAGGTEKILDLKDFLRKHWQEVHAATGQDFNYKILTKNEVLYDTEPACRAVMLVGQLKPEVQYEYFKAVQHSFYYENNLPNDDNTYVALAQNFGIDGATFNAAFKNPQSKMDVYSEFDLAASMGITSFPTLIAKINGKLYVATNGFQKAEKIITLLKNRGLE